MNIEKIFNEVGVEVKKLNRLQKPFLEIILKPKDETKNKPRIALCCLDIQVSRPDAEDKFASLAYSEFNFEVFYHVNFDGLVQNNHFPKVRSTSPENNWRGRLFAFSTIQDKTPAELNDFLLNSFWRLIVDRDLEGRYYIHHDLYPCFVSPGWSALGVQNPLEGFEDEFKLMLRRFDSGHIDLEFDYFKLFVKQNNERKYTPLEFELDGVTKDKITFPELIKAQIHIISVFRSFYNL